MTDDFISRQAAIRWVKTECNPYGKPTLEFESGKKVIEHLEQMPSAQPQRKTGRWLNIDESEKWKCSVCGRMMWFSPRLGVKPSDYNFCPNCGALMDEEVEGRKK